MENKRWNILQEFYKYKGTKQINGNVEKLKKNEPRELVLNGLFLQLIQVLVKDVKRFKMPINRNGKKRKKEAKSFF